MKASLALQILCILKFIVSVSHSDALGSIVIAASGAAPYKTSLAFAAFDTVSAVTEQMLGGNTVVVAPHNTGGVNRIGRSHLH